MSSQKDTRGTDPLDHLRLSCSEGNVVATKVAKAAVEFAQRRIAELERKASAVDGFLAAIEKPFTEDELQQIEKAKLSDRKAAAFDAIAYRKVFVRDCSRGDDVLLTAYPRCGFLPFSPDELLTAIEAALEGKEPGNG